MKKSVQYFYIAIFFILVMVPVLLYSVIGKKLGTTSYENRKLATMPVLSVKTISTFPSSFENYFNDNLPFKNQLVFLNGLFDYKIFKTSSSESVIVGKRGWLFYKGAQVNDEDPVSDYNGSNLFTDDQLKTIGKNMLAARDELASRNIDFVIMIAPNKERVYSEYMPAAYGKPAAWGRMAQVVDYLRNNTDLKVVCPYDEIAAYKEKHPQDQLYYKYDTHWNNLGAYIGGGLLDKTLGYDMPQLNTLTKTAGNVPRYDLATLLHLGNILEDDPAYVLDGYSSHNVTIQKNDSATEFRGTISDGSGDDRKLFIIGDSFSTMMFQYVACNFDNSYLNFYYNYNLQMLEKEEPDVVVYETVERYLNNMLHFSIKDGIEADAE